MPPVRYVPACFTVCLGAFRYLKEAVGIAEHYSLSAEYGGAKFPEKFTSLDHSFVSLFQLLTLDQWHVIYKDLMSASGLPVSNDLVCREQHKILVLEQFYNT